VLLVYVILSPAYGMQQYTADLVNHRDGAQHVIAPRSINGGWYSPPVRLQTMARVRGTGLQTGSLRLDALHEVYRAVRATEPTLVHFTARICGTLRCCCCCAAPVSNRTRFTTPTRTQRKLRRLLYAWNAAVLRCADHILVHGQVYRQRLIRQGCSPARVTYAPLLHLFTSYAAEQRLRARTQPPAPDDPPFALFFGRLEAYKGLSMLVEALAACPPPAPSSPARATWGRLGLAALPGLSQNTRISRI
jgi:glycosyltransferase involved in cell wall biosynthesis